MNFSRQQIATIIALAFHVSGLIAIGFFHSELFISLTPINLLVCALLIFWTQQEISFGFIIFCFAAFNIGFYSEWVGVNTGILFGEYTYGEVLGAKWHGVPYIIGLQWLVVSYCAGMCMTMLHNRILQKQEEASINLPKWWITASIVADSALIALVFDWILEPVAMKLGYWSWEGNEVPWLNYASWWGVSAVIMLFFHFLKFKKHNLFALHLLMIQAMFFLILRTLGKV